MADIRETQLRLTYSLLRVAVRAAAGFRIPMRTATELLRLAYFELLRSHGLTQAEIGSRLGQTDRHMRSLAQRLRSDFFTAEREMGVVRELEGLVAQRRPTERELPALLPAFRPNEIERAVDQLVAEQRITRGTDGQLETGARYATLASDVFHRRLDALNDFLDGVYEAVMHRLVLDDKRTAMLKTITFRADPAALEAFVTRLEGELRREIAALEEQALFSGPSEHRFTLGLALAPCEHAPRS